MKETVERADQTQRPALIELSVALAALVVAAASLFIAQRQTAVMDRQLAASVWPVVQVGSGNVDPETGDPQITLIVENAGVGPAWIRSFRVGYGGSPMRTVNELLLMCCTSDSSSASRGGVFAIDSRPSGSRGRNGTGLYRHINGLKPGRRPSARRGPARAGRSHLLLLCVR